MNILQKRIQEASQKYYEDGTSPVSDAEFDQMLEQLKKEDPDSPLLTQVGHGYDVQKDATLGDKVKHRYGDVGSLDKCHNWKEFPNSQKGRHVWASLKLDGMSVVLYYKEGKLFQALTRGQDNIGVDITEKVKVIINREEIDSTFTGAVRGEIIMTKDSFDVYLLTHPEAKNPRNTTVGIVKSASKDISPDLSYLSIIVYTVIGCESDPSAFVSYPEMNNWLSDNFELVVPIRELSKNVCEYSFENTMQLTDEKWRCYGYPSDGIVLTNEVVEYNDSTLIYTASAFKFKAESAVTKVIGIEWNLSKTKYLIPRINFETVQLSGTSVSWAAGNNAKNILDSGIGEGAELSVLKSGEIIPYVDNVVKPVEPYLPQTCPCCGAHLEWQGVHLVCPNPDCADADIQDVLVWLNAICPYDGLGDTLKLAFLQEIFGEDNISVESLYIGNPTFFNPKLVKKKEWNSMVKELYSKKIPLSDAIKALNIPRLGDVTSRKLAEYPEIVINAMNSVINDREAEVIGKANAESMMKNIDKFKRLAYIKDQIEWKTIPKKDLGKVAITGKLSVKRSVFEDELRSFGYTPGSISKDTKFLITDDPDSSTDKNKKADQWGIVKITEQEFRTNYL